MALPTTEELEGVIVDILTRARDEGRLSELTVRIVLRDLATHYGIEQDVFQSKTYKPFIKATVYATVKAQVNSSDKDAAEEADASECEAPTSKGASSRLKSSKSAERGKTSRKPESELKYKSKAIIESSDEEAATESGTRKSARSPKKGQTSAKSSPSKQKKVNKGDSDVEMDAGPDAGPSSSGSKPKPATESPKHSVSKTKESVNGDQMESELSSVIDEPRTNRQKKQEKSVKPQKDEKKKRGKKEVLSKDEETVNKLKGIVVACGVRKVWKKEFEGLDKPSQQIKRLHSILSDLGMTPRYTLEKAKAIRGQRELAQELKDVQEFDKATKGRAKGLRSSSETGVSTEQDDSDVVACSRKKQNARARIMAFLQDQSEEE
ncbi:hypothetical protein JVT61DRAFT_334 [Boletus reticuloceps]|uniref:Uncharacterized protein n=1 Tax=Boletus reticuloceps TaxID=495285 RepID=A0A8I2YZM0_9AGAM|nr:hypothetical protein JVT61DRAFT_334 [Boletus reticuloceps]